MAGRAVLISLLVTGAFAVSEINAGSTASTSERSRIYFSAYLKSHTTTGDMIQFQPIVFSEVITNEGGAYNANTGEFTAPRTGAYALFWEFLVFPNGTVVLDLQKQNQTYAHSYAHGSDSEFEVASKSVILDLAKDETVRVVYYMGNGTLHGAAYNKYTTFSGFSL